jgi:chromate transporter
LRARLRELLFVFGRLGTTAVGGPAVHLAMTRTEVVQRRRWLAEAEYLDLIGMANLVPGPTSTEVAMHVGRVRAGWRGLLVAGVAFILPATLIVVALAWAYDRYGARPAVDDILRGLKPVVLAVVVDALVGFGRTAIRGPFSAVLLVAAAAAHLAGIDELAVLVVAGTVHALWARRRSLPGAALAAAVPLAADPSLWRVAGVFLRIGAVLYGSGYVLLAFLRHDVVDVHGWLTEAQLLDAVAIGQVTPGPVFTTATFVGFLVAGWAGAAVATVAIFLPSFVFVAATGGLVARLRRSPWTAAVLDGVNAAAVGLMAGVCLALGGDAVVDGWTAALAVAALAVLVRFRPNPAWLLLVGGLLGWGSPLVHP